MDSKFQVLFNIYFGAKYLIKFIYLENLVLLFALVIWYFKFNIIGSF